MRTDRLLRLADHLETVVAKAPETFDMDTFGRAMACGTVCCALGHACSIPEFREAGLRMEWVPDGPNECGEVVVAGARNFGAAEVFFGIEDRTASYLFGPDDPEAPKRTTVEVADRIRKFVAANTPVLVGG